MSENIGPDGNTYPDHLAIQTKLLESIDKKLQTIIDLAIQQHKENIEYRDQAMKEKNDMMSSLSKVAGPMNMASLIKSAFSGTNFNKTDKEKTEVE